jgi:hypothetical protein
MLATSFVFVLHVLPGIRHGLDGLAEADLMAAVAVHGQPDRVDRLDGAIAFRSMQGIWTRPPTGSQVSPISPVWLRPNMQADMQTVWRSATLQA